MTRILVTGGAGFIGSAVVRQLILDSGDSVINVDKLTYAGNLDSLAAVRNHPNYIFEQVDICNPQEMARCFDEHQPEAIMHLAAESHVDRSIEQPADFMQSNVVGTYTLLETARDSWNRLKEPQRRHFRFHHVSSDEVYGDLGPTDPAFTEVSPYRPSSPYAASKASSDHLVRAWHRTFGLPTLVTNCSNNYGPYQFPEKLIPLIIVNGLQGQALPIYGDGHNIRDWLYVEDHARALRLALKSGKPGQTYNIGGRSEKTNLDVVRSICQHLDMLAPRKGGPYARLIEFVTDRPGHDRRYAIDDSRISVELGWQPRETFESGLAKTVRWYLDNPEWIKRVQTGAYRGWLDANYRHRSRL